MDTTFQNGVTKMAGRLFNILTETVFGTLIGVFLKGKTSEDLNWKLNKLWNVSWELHKTSLK